MRNLLLVISMMGLLSYSIGQHKEIILTKQQKQAEVYSKFNIEQESDKPLQSAPTSNIKDDAVGQSLYDLQTYNSLQRRMYTWPDGSTGITWIMGFESGSWPDQGTGYNYFDGNNWGTTPSQIIEENQPSNSPNYFRFGENGEIIVSHYQGDHWKLSFHTREIRGQGNWESFELEGPESNVGVAWASVMVNGDDNKTIHVLAKSTENPYMGQTSAFIYSRSQDGGITWDILHHYFDELGLNYLNNVGRDTYTWAYPKGDTIAFTTGFGQGNGYVMKSFDNGNTWDKISVYENPYSPYEGGATPRFGSGDGTSAIALDSEGNAHVVFSRMVYYYDDMSTPHYYPATEGLIYWNETMPMLDTTAVSSYTLDHLQDGGNLIGWVTSSSGDSTLVGWATYYLSLTSWPQIVIDPDDNIYVVYSGVAADYDNNFENYRHIYANSSNDNGETWNGLMDINTDLIYTYSECIFPAISPIVQNSKLNICFQYDEEPGLYVWIGQQQNPTDNTIQHISLDASIFVGTEENYHKESKLYLCSNYPNPFKDQTSIEFQLNQESNVILQIRDITGKLKINYDLGLKEEGNNVIQFENRNLKSGIYFYTLITENEAYSGKMVVR